MGKKLILLFLPLLCALADQEYRNWTNKQGKSIEARFIKFTKEKFEIRRKDGRTFTMTSDMLSEEDQKFLEELRKRADSRGYIWDASSASYELKRQSGIEWQLSRDMPKLSSFLVRCPWRLMGKIE